MKIYSPSYFFGFKVLLIFFCLNIILFSTSVESARGRRYVPSPCTTVYYDCSYCAQTTCACGSSEVSEPAITVNSIQFNWSHRDSNTSNDVCRGSTGGTCYCNAGVTSYSNNRLPANNGVCNWPAPGNRLPASGVTCKWRDGNCSTPCSNWVSRTCSTCR